MKVLQRWKLILIYCSKSSSVLTKNDHNLIKVITVHKTYIIKRGKLGKVNVNIIFFLYRIYMNRKLKTNKKILNGKKRRRKKTVNKLGNHGQPCVTGVEVQLHV